MSITIGIYDLFAYSIPGIIYLYIINEVLRLLGIPNVDISRANSGFEGVLLGLAAYITGHLFDALSSRAWDYYFGNGRSPEAALNMFKQRHPYLHNQFEPSQWQILLAVIRNRNPQIEERIAYHNALSIMLRSVSFSLFLYSLLQIVLVIFSHYPIQYLILAVTTLGLSFVAMRRSITFGNYYFLGIYESAVTYGNDLAQILASNPSGPATPQGH